MHHANGKLLVAAAPNTQSHTPLRKLSPECGQYNRQFSHGNNNNGSSNAGDLNNDWGEKERATVVTIEREGTVDNKPYIDDPHLGFHNDSNGPHPNVGLNNSGSAFPQSNGADNQDYVVLGSQNDGNNSLENNTSSIGLNNSGSKNIDPAGDPFIERRENDGLGDTPLPFAMREFFMARGWDPDETDGDSCSSGGSISCSSIGTLSSVSDDYGLGDGPPSWCSDPIWEKAMLQEQAMDLLDDSMRTQDRAPQTYDTATLTYNDNYSLTEPPQLLQFQPDPPALYNSTSNDSRDGHEVDNTVATTPNTNHTPP